MGLGISLAGTLTDGSHAAAWLQRAQAWLHESWGTTLMASEVRRDASDTPMLCFQLHPRATDVQICARERSRLTVIAATSMTGPGYHTHVCGLLHTLSRQLAVFWEPAAEIIATGDQTGFFSSGDRSALEQAMLTWLRGKAQTALTRAAAGRHRLSLSLDPGHRFEFEGAIATPLGPRTEAWLRAVAEDPSAGIDVFPWWAPGLDAKYRLGRALSEMWTDVRWRKPVSDAESAQLRRILKLLRDAYSEAPELDYPWHEWDELAGYADDPRGAPAKAHEPSAPLIGYRRRDVRVELLGGWSVTLPGSFAETWNDDGSYCAWGGGRTVWFASHDQPEDPATGPAQVARPGLNEGSLAQGDRPVQLPKLPAAYDRRAWVARCPGDGDTVCKLTAHLALAGRRAHVSIVFDDPHAEDWAIHTVESVRGQAPEDEG